MDLRATVVSPVQGSVVEVDEVKRGKRGRETGEATVGATVD